MPSRTTTTLARTRLLAGLLLVGQAILTLSGILDHEAPTWLAALALILGIALLAWPSRAPAAGPRADPTTSRPGRRAVILALGLTAILGVVAYNLAIGNGWALPELAILAYGATLILASRHLERTLWRTDVNTLVAYSFPLILAPLSLYAVNAAITTGLGATPLAFYIQHGLVTPMTAALRLAGIDVTLHGDTVALATTRGKLFLTVGVVCAGLYAAVIFLGVFALFAWQQDTRGWRLAAYLTLGLIGLHLANVLRLILLALVGWRWGGAALQTFHQHAGWVLFLLWTLLFWWLVLRRFEGPTRQRAAP